MPSTGTRRGRGDPACRGRAQPSEPQFRYPSRAAAEWWVAEDGASGSLVGYARSIGREGAGPLAALEASDLAAELTHVEGRAHALDLPRLVPEVPGLHALAVRHL